MGITIDDSREGTPMSREEVVETLKAMVFGAQAFERFTAKEREALDKAWNMIDQQEPTTKIEESNFSWEQYKADLQSAYDCGKSILGKIRADISALQSHHINDCYDDGFQGCRTSVLEIIDKYKTETEG